MRGAPLILLLLAASDAATLTVLDNADVTGNLSELVDYTGILEEDKKYTLESLTTDTENNWPHEEENAEENATEGVEEEGFTEAAVSRDPRIVTQTAATAGQFPYNVLLTVTTRRANTMISCGGAIISDSWVLTAAQCVYSATAIKVDAGQFDTSMMTTLQTSMGVAYIYPHFKQNYLMHDIALVNLLTPFALTANVYPIQLVKKDYHGNELNLATVRTMGFGPLSDTGTVGTLLNYVDLMHLSKAACAAQTAPTFVSYPHTTSCLSSSSGKLGFCLGDTGGPVVFKFSSELTFSLLGINSIYQGCPSTYPMAYTRVGPYLKWIKSKVPKLL